MNAAASVTGRVVDFESLDTGASTAGRLDQVSTSSLVNLVNRLKLVFRRVPLVLNQTLKLFMLRKKDCRLMLPLE